jgi:thiol:disulfide interchange protein
MGIKMKSSVIWIGGAVIGMVLIYSMGEKELGVGVDTSNNGTKIINDEVNSPESSMFNAPNTSKENYSKNMSVAEDSAKDWLAGVNENVHPMNVDEAFKYSVVREGDVVIAEWIIGKEYKLYSDKLKIEVEGADADISYPKGEKYTDALGVESVIFKDIVRIEINLKNKKSDSVKIISKYQGCWDGGVCYPPVEKTNTIMVD